jgi:hypothetical protein
VAGVKGALASVAAWVLGAVTAVGVGLIALTMIGGGLSHDPVQPLSADDLVGSGGVTSAPTTAPTSAPTTSSSASTRPAPAPNSVSTGSPKLLTSRGGTVVARCHSDNNSYLVFWSPAQGYRVGEVMRGPAPVTRVEFHGYDREVTITVTCQASTPHGDVREESEGPYDH